MDYQRRLTETKQYKDASNMQIYNKITDETKLDEIEEYLSFWGRPLRKKASCNSAGGFFVINEPAKVL